MSNKWILLTNKEMNMLADGLIPYSVLKKIERARKIIKISSRKGKGRSLQMWVAKRISKLIDIPFDNQDDQCLIHCREMGQSGVDVTLRKEAQTAFPFSIECKNSESLDIMSTINQAKSNQADGTFWMIVHKRKALSDPVVILDWYDFESIFSATMKRKGKYI